MIKRIAVWCVVAVAVVLAIQVLMREGPPPSLVVPPKMELPRLDPRPEREPSQPAEPSCSTSVTSASSSRCGQPP